MALLQADQRRDRLLQVRTVRQAAIQNQVRVLFRTLGFSSLTSRLTGFALCLFSLNFRAWPENVSEGWIL